MQAITLTRLPATDTKPDRWQAKADAGVLRIYDYTFHVYENDPAIKAAGVDNELKLCLYLFLKKFQWGGHWVIGQDHKGNYQAVCAGNFGMGKEPTIQYS